MAPEQKFIKIIINRIIYQGPYIYLICLRRGAYRVHFETLVVHTGTFGTYGDGPRIIIDTTADERSSAQNSLYA